MSLRNCAARSEGVDAGDDEEGGGDEAIIIAAAVLDTEIWESARGRENARERGGGGVSARVAAEKKICA